MNIFVTGTDTNIGKTVVSSWICLQSQAKYWKPIQTGDDSDSKLVSIVSPKTKIMPEIYKLAAPLSPFDSAKLENKIIDVNGFKRTSVDKCVIEGAGGVFVPIAENFLMVDLIKCTNSKAVIVAKSQLGFINHILLTVEALKSRHIEIVGIVINGKVENNLFNTIELFSKCKILQVLPMLDNGNFNLLQDIELPKELKEVLS